MPAALPTFDVANAVDRLLAAERGDAFGFLAGAGAYVGHSAAVWAKVQQVLAAGRHRQAELAALLETLGAMPRAGAFSADVQYLAFLSMDFLLPKLIAAKQQSIRRYEDALEQIGDANAPVAAVLSRHLEEHRAELATLRNQSPATTPVPPAPVAAPVA
jgi:hypothetical protein